MVGLGDVTGSGMGSVAYDVSADGSVIVGVSRDGAGAFYWTAEAGMRSLQQMLTDAGVDLTGWSLANATGVSADGSTVVGYGLNPER